MYWIHHSSYFFKILPFLGGWLADRIFGDPENWPHPIVGFGKIISIGEKKFNRGEYRGRNGALLAFGLIGGVFVITYLLLEGAGQIRPGLAAILTGIGVFYCLAGKTLPVK